MKKLTDLQLLKNDYDVPDEAIAFVKSANSETPNGRYEFGETCYVNVSVCETKVPTDASRFEAHKKYIDVQILLAGEEKIFYTDKGNLKIAVPYDAQKDAAFYHFDHADAVDYKMGESIVLDTNEAHLPCCAVTLPMTVKKAVMKLKK